MQKRAALWHKTLASSKITLKRYRRTAWFNDSKNASGFCWIIKMKPSYLVLGEQSNIAVAACARVDETCRNGATDPESS